MRRKPWKIVLALLGGMVLVVGGIVGDAHRRAAALLDRERTIVDAQIAAWLARDHARPPALGEPLDGNAWDDYGPAFAQLGAMPTELTELLPRLTDSPEEFTPDDHAIHNVLREYRSTLERLHQGTRRRTVHQRALTLNARDELQFGEAIRSCKVLADIVAHEHRMGHDDEALAAAATGLALAQDYGRSGALMNAFVQFVGEAHVCWELKEALGEGSLSPSALGGFAAMLDRLDASRPEFMDCWKGEELLEKRSVLDADWDGLFPYWTGLAPPKPPHVWPSWRALYSERMTRAQALPRYSEIFRAVESLRALSAWERVAEAKKIEQEYDPKGPRAVKGNVILAALGPSIGRGFEQDAMIQMQRILLRVSVAIALFEAEAGRFPERLEALAPRFLPRVPVCPLTGLPLHYGDGKVWSVGKNRVDDGGKPGRNDSAYDEDGDVVWVVKRRK